IPAVIRELSDREVLELAIIENIQREDLNPIEEALAYKKLIQEFGLTQEEIAQRVGKDRSTIANKLRLLSLPEEAKKALMEGKITEGHARALLGIRNEEKRKKVLQEILRGKKTVREVERKAKARDPQIKALEDELSSYLGTKVRIVKGRKKGKIEIEFYSLDELDRLLELIKGEER
ncbi:chromosome partitioning protein ParB, partial [bacterium]